MAQNAEKIENRKQTINNLAVAACKLMNDVEREEYFQYQEAREENNESAQKRVKNSRYYYSGARKGQLKDVYHIDGVLYMKLWDLCKPYVVTSAVKSCYDAPHEVEEVVSEIKMNLFHILRHFGPRPNNMNFSDYLHLNVNNLLTNHANARLRREKSSVTYKTTSLFQEVASSEDGALRLIDTITEEDAETVSFFSKIPNEYKEAVKMLLNGEKLTEVLKTTKISKPKFLAAMAKCV